MFRVLSVFGTRPEAVKMAPLVKRIKAAKELESMVCVTAQHRDLLDQVLAQFDIKPDYDLNLMKAGQSLTGIAAGVIEGLGHVILKAKPDLVLVHGDTTTTAAAALAAFYSGIPIGHVEAGLRSFNMRSPFPEEMNRCLTSRMATLHFTPTEANKQNLEKEGITQNIFVVGNTVIDALHQLVHEGHTYKSAQLNALPLLNERLVLLTAHRRENLGMPLKNICRAARRLADTHGDIRIVYPVHPNPAVRETVFSLLSNHPRIHLIDPIEVEDMHNLLSRAYLVLTDSGGLQEEAPALGKPVIVLRTETERPEIVAAGKAILAGVEESSIYNAASRLLNDAATYKQMASAINPYGDGHTAERIVDIILQYAQGK